MSNIDKTRILKAKKYATKSGATRNPISTLMEIGQLLHITPEFDCFEHETSTVHLHVFICQVKFANYSSEARGYRKKLVKTEAAKKLLEYFIERADGSNFTSSIDGARRDERETNGRSTVLCQVPEASTRTPFLGSYSAVEQMNADKERSHIAAKDSNDMLGLTKSVKMATCGKPGKVEGAILEALKNLCLDEKITTERIPALEKLLEFSRKKCFDIDFYDVMSSDGKSHMCLLEAKIGPSLVTHGIADNRHQARENAAESMLSVVHFCNS